MFDLSRTKSRSGLSEPWEIQEIFLRPNQQNKLNDGRQMWIAIPLVRQDGNRKKHQWRGRKS
jgi:hypothetical protein